MTCTKNMESVLFHALDILEKNKIDYWITDGTLLGIVRENRLLPWDCDLDIGIWKSKNSITDIVSLFENFGFSYCEHLADMDCLHFYYQGIQLDIGLYSVENNNVIIKWATYPNNKIVRTYLKFINKLFEVDRNSFKFKFKFLDIFSLNFYLNLFFILFSLFLSKGFKKKLYNYSKKRFSFKGCFYPFSLFSFSRLYFKGRAVVIPKDSKEYLRLIYGNDWLKPNKNFDWTRDTHNLKDFNN